MTASGFFQFDERIGQPIPLEIKKMQFNRQDAKTAKMEKCAMYFTDALSPWRITFLQWVGFFVGKAFCQTEK
jgi:hypothetical protein